MNKTTTPKKPTTRIARAAETIDELADLVSATTRLVRRLAVLGGAISALAATVAAAVAFAL